MDPAGGQVGPAHTGAHRRVVARLSGHGKRKPPEAEADALAPPIGTSKRAKMRIVAFRDTKKYWIDRLWNLSSIRDERDRNTCSPSPESVTHLDRDESATLRSPSCIHVMDLESPRTPAGYRNLGHVSAAVSPVVSEMQHDPALLYLQQAQKLERRLQVYVPQRRWRATSPRHKNSRDVRS